MNQSATLSWGATLTHVKGGAYTHPGRSTAESGRGYVYVIEFVGGGIKVGKTIRPQGRIRQHQSVSEIYGHPISRVWMSGPHEDYDITERCLISFCAESSSPERPAGGAGTREYFPFGFDATVEYAETLTVDAASAALSATPRQRPVPASSDLGEYRTSICERIALNVYQARQRRKWLLAELCRETGLSLKAVAMIENGRRPPTIDELTSLCGALRITLAELCAGADPESLDTLGLSAGSSGSQKSDAAA